MNNYKYLIIVIIALLAPGEMNAQETKVVRDLRLWSGIEIEKSLFKSLVLSLEEEVRFEKNISRVENLLTQVGVEYDISKNFSVGGKYRYAKKKGSDGFYETRSRYMIDLKYKIDIHDFSLQYRLRQQKEVESMRIFHRSEASEKHIRHKFTFNYDQLKKMRPCLSAELFQRYEWHEKFYSDNIRFLGGIRYRTEEFGQVKIEYGIEQELNRLVPATFFLFKVNYTYKF